MVHAAKVCDGFDREAAALFPHSSETLSYVAVIITSYGLYISLSSGTWHSMPGAGIVRTGQTLSAVSI